MPSRSVPFQSDTFRYDTTRLFRPAATCWLCSGYSVAFWPPISGCLAVVGSRSQKEKRARVRLANPKDTAEMAPTLAGPGPPVLLLLPLAKLSPTDLCQRFLCQQPLARSPLELSHSLRLFLCLTIYLFISLSLAIYVISRALSLPFPRLHAHSLSHSLLPSLSLPLSLSASLSISHFRLVNVSVSVFFYVAFGGRLFLACVCVCEGARCCLLYVGCKQQWTDDNVRYTRRPLLLLLLWLLQQSVANIPAGHTLTTMTRSSSSFIAIGRARTKPFLPQWD